MAKPPSASDIDSSKIRAAVADAIDGAGSGGHRPPADCVQGEVLSEINGKLDQVLERLAKGDTALALLNHRVAFLEKIVYGMCGLILVAVIGAIIALVVRSHP